MRIDLNADLGEMNTPEGWASDRAILEVVSSASIACGGHAGDVHTMARAVEAAGEFGVRVGAHPSYPDRDGFGRRSGFMEAGAELRKVLERQVGALRDVAGEGLGYIKPHGALYNDAVADGALAEMLVELAEGFGLPLMGAPVGEVVAAARGRVGYIAEGFIDRRYGAHGHLVSRSELGAVLESETERLEQLESLALEGRVAVATEEVLQLRCDTLCLHGDSPGAVATARAARARLEALGVEVGP